jgi:DNA repair exonuclease SbcCD ATPase subunit
MRETGEKPIREQYSRELMELTSTRKQAWSPEEAIDEQIEREAKELRPVLEALRNLAQASALHDYVVDRWTSASSNDRSALDPILRRAAETRTTASEEVERMKSKYAEAVQRLFVLSRLRRELDHGLRERFSG